MRVMLALYLIRVCGLLLMPQHLSTDPSLPIQWPPILSPDVEIASQCHALLDLLTDAFTNAYDNGTDIR